MVEQTDEYLQVEFRTAVISFVDDVEFVLDAEHNKIDVRSASRTGYSDLGVNRRRVERIRRAFHSAVQPQTLNDLAAYRWHARLLLLIAVDPDDVVAKALLEQTSEVEAEIEARDLRIFRYTEDPGWRAELQIPPARRIVVLIGKDGGVKMVRTKEVSISEIFAAVDAMPMRQQEVEDANTR